MSGETPRGRFVWYDLVTPDPEAGAKFYTAVTGWGTTTWEGGPHPYTMFTRDDVPLGGITPLSMMPEGTPPHWLAYVSTPDVDATAARAEELGGRVLSPPDDIPEVGRFAILGDPQGAVFAVYRSSGEAPGHDGPPRVGEFSWHELATTDHGAALAFYSELFAWDTAEAMDMGEAGTYQMYSRKGLPLGGMFDKPAEMPGPPAWLHYIRVDDVHQGAEKLAGLGGKVINGPMEVPGGDYIAQCVDPQGAMFAVHHHHEDEG